MIESQKIGIYSIEEVDKLIEELFFLENTLLNDLNEIMKVIKEDFFNSRKISSEYRLIKNEIGILQDEINIMEHLVEIDEMVKEIRRIYFELINHEKISGKEFLNKIELLHDENKLALEISKLDQEVRSSLKKINTSDAQKLEKIINDFTEIANHIHKIEKIF